MELAIVTLLIVLAQSIYLKKIDAPTLLLCILGFILPNYLVAGLAVAVLVYYIANHKKLILSISLICLILNLTQIS